MTVGRLPDRDRHDPEALLADRYLEDLLSAAERGADAVPADVGVDPGLRDAASVLRRSLVRVHPSFRFEERVSARLAGLAAAAGGALPATPGGGPLIPYDRLGATAIDPLLPAILAGALDPADDAAMAAEPWPAGVARPLLVGGAITSAALSLVGVAWVAWRASRPRVRPSATLMARVALAAHARRLAGTAADAAGNLGGPA
jgi:hypothetical protein